ncbi:MAG TPA: ester cyclase, partial [Thermomicrobiales bacterium]|nr:ester cyclase [Thermomicrobiales bacterium]
MKTFRVAFPDLVMSVDNVIAEDDFVGEVLTLRGTHTGTFAGIPPTGKPIEIKSVNICRIEDGLVRERWGASDDLGLLRQIGLLPSPGTRAWTASIKAASAQIKLGQHRRQVVGATAAAGAGLLALVMRRRGSRG